jgi:hypothetical protein
MVDEETRLDRTEVGPGAVATYHHSFTNYSSSQITAEIVEAKVEPTVRQNVCGNADMRPSLEFGVTYVYAYSGNDGVAIYEFSINATDCGIPTGSP